MSDYTVKRIAGKLHELFDGRIDLSDVATRPKDQQNEHFNTRALAAMCVRYLCSVSEELAADSVTDGFGDGGIDALYLDRVHNALILATSKWSKNGQGGPDRGDVHKFVDGIQKILAPDLRSFNSKILNREPEIAAALRDPSVQLVLAVAYTGPQLSPHTVQPLEELVQKLNENAPMARMETLQLSQIYQILASESENVSTDVDLYLRHWGKVSHPFIAYYGHVHSDELAHWWAKYSGMLCAKNLRQFMHRTEVNEAIARTVQEEPHLFWYLNNGITIICDKIEPTLAGGGEKKLGIFRLKRAHVVNGAQTIGVIGNTSKVAGTADGPVEQLGHGAWVQVRIISLESVPEGFDVKITKATNFQNAVAPRDFAALDPLQQKLAMDFSFDRRKYAFKSGDEEPTGDAGCGIVEATQALACSDPDVSTAVSAKRYISGVWLDEKLYHRVFSPNLTSKKVWNAVQVMRASASELENLKRSTHPRAEYVASHLRFLVHHLVFRDPRIRIWDLDADIDRLKYFATIDTRAIFPLMAKYVEDNHRNDYLANFSKNESKCATLISAVEWVYPDDSATAVDSQTPPESPRGEFQTSLFSDANLGS